MRAAALQFAVGDDISLNLKTALRMIDAAAKHKPDLIVLPEFVNHIGWYPDAAYAYRVAVPFEGEFLRAIAARAARVRAYIAINVTVPRGEGKITSTCVLYAPDGSRLASSDKQILAGDEHHFLAPASAAGEIGITPFGGIGMYASTDGAVNETARGLALRGASVLAASLNTFNRDHAELFAPARAAENRVFIVAANKVGWLIPEALTEKIALYLNIAPEQIRGTGGSCIIAPDGTVLAAAPDDGEAIVTADFDPAQAGDKIRPDGTDIFASRRPSLYGALARKPAERRYTPGANEIAASVGIPTHESIDGCLAVIREAAARGAKIVTLPELPHLPNGHVEDVAFARRESERLIGAAIEALTGNDTLAVFSVVGRLRGSIAHVGVVLGAEGILLEQGQIHPSARHAWIARLDDSIRTLRRPWGRVAVITGGDSIYPETFRLAALQNAEVCAVPTHLLGNWEMRAELPTRAAENRFAVLPASRPTESGSGGIFAVTPDFTLWTEWQSRRFEGFAAMPIVTPADIGVTIAPVYPSAAANRLLAERTDVVDGRPWWLMDAYVSA